MKTTRRQFLKWTVAGSTLLWAGCGGSQEASTGGTVLPTLQRGNGVVYLDGPQTGIPVRIFSSDGTLLHVTATGSDGMFSIPGDIAQAPAYLLEAEFAPGSALQFLTSDPTTIWMDVPGHLATLLHQLRPELSEQEAFLRTREGLRIPARQATQGLSSLPGSPFSAAELVRQAGGDFAGFTRQLAERIGQGERITIQTPNPFPPLSFNEVQAKSESTGGVLTFLASNAAEDLYSIGLDSVLGRVCASIGWNVGERGEFTEVLQQLQDIEAQVNELGKQIDATSADSSYTNLDQTLRGFERDLLLLNEGLKAATLQAQNDADDTFNRGPEVAPTYLADLTSALDNYDANSALITFVAALVTKKLSENIVLLQNDLQMSQVGVDATNSEGSFYYPLRQDPYTLTLQKDMDYWRTRVVQIANLVSEGAQRALLEGTGQSPASAMNQARTNIFAAVQAMLAAQMQVPEPLNVTNVLVDVPNHLMWYLSYGSEDQYNNVQQKVTNLRAWSSSDWVLPSQGQLDSLRAWASNQAGLEKLGFVGASAGNSKLHTNKQPTPDSPFDPDPNGDGRFDYYYYDIDTGDTGTEVLASGGGPLYSWLAVREIGTASDLALTSWDDVANELLQFGFLPTSLQIGGGPDLLTLDGFFNIAGAPDTGSVDLAWQAEWEIVGSDPLDPIVDFLPAPGIGPDDDTAIQLTWHRPGKVTFRATVYGVNPANGQGSSITATIDLTSPLSAVPAPTSVRVSPQNFATASVPANIKLYLTGFLPGGTAQDLTSQATWSVNVPNSVAYMDATDPGNLVIVALGATTQLVVTAQSGGLSDSTTIVFPSP